MIYLIYAMIIFKYIIYGSSVFFTGKLVSSTNVFDVIALRFLLSSVIFILLRLLKIIKINFRGKNLRPLFFAALFEPVLYFIFETFGISMTSNTIAGIIIAFAPAAACIAADLILKERTNIYQKICLLTGIAGVIYIVLRTNVNDGVNSAAGIVLMFMAVISGALYAVYSRKSSSQFNAMEVTYFSSIFGAVVFNAINVTRHLFSGDIAYYFAPYASFDNMIGFLFLAVLSTIVATSFNNYALSKIQTSRVSVFGGISTVVTIMEGTLLNHEPLYLYHVIGTAMIVLSIIGVNYFSDKSHHKQEIL